MDLIGRVLKVHLKNLMKSGWSFEQKWRVEQKTVKLDELGDVLIYTCQHLARFLKLSPEEAMVHANQKFKSTVFIC